MTSSSTARPAAGALTPELQRAAARVSEAHAQLVRHACADPAWHARGPFAPLNAPHAIISDPVQSWPTLLGGAARVEMERATVGLSRLIRKLPGLVFDYDADAISAYYQLDLDFIRHFVMPPTTQTVLDGAFGRADFVLTADRLWCVEFNLAANVGGIWEAPGHGERMMSLPLVRDYLARLGIEVRSRNSLRVMLRQVVTHARRHAALLSQADDAEWRQRGAVNVAYAIAKAAITWDDTMHAVSDYLANEYAEACRELAQESGDDAREARPGAFVLCGFEELAVDGPHLTLNGRRIHALLEFTAGDVPVHVLRCHAQGGFTLHNGPATYLLCNKLNLALLSEYADSGLFDAGEQALIDAHVPWTRKVTNERATMDGVDVLLPAFILEQREQLLLKKSISRSGHDVVPGIDTAPDAWARALEHALFERDWIVQQYHACPVLPYQHGEHGWLPHRGVWGMFVFGDAYGGGFLRLQPDVQGAVVATSRGAVDGVVLEID